MFLLEKEEKLLDQLRSGNLIESRDAREELKKLDIIQKFFIEFNRIAKQESMNHEGILEILEIFKLLKDKRCMPYLLRIIRQSPDAYKIKAIQALALIPDPSTLNTLFLALKLYDDEVKVEALKIIDLVKNTDCIEPLFTVASTADDDMADEIVKVLKKFQATHLKNVAIKLLLDDDVQYSEKARIIMEHLFGSQKAAYIIGEYTGQRTVLVCDKLLNQRSTFTKYFADSGFQVVGSAGTPEISLKICQEKQPDVVTMDLCMPTEEEGIRLLKAIKKLHPEAGIIMCSSSTNKKMIIEAMNSGAAQYLLKPVEKNVLMESTRKFLKERANRRTKM